MRPEASPAAGDEKRYLFLGKGLYIMGNMNKRYLEVHPVKYHENVEKNRQAILDTERYVWNHPETGFKEWQTQAYLAKVFEDAGYTLTYAGNVPGFYTDIDTGRPGPKLLILGEMDALGAPNHMEAKNGNAHACGHNVQCAALVGTALALKEPGVLDALCGSIRLMAVPAEELIEIDYRETLRRQGIIRYLGGKLEFLYRGYMDGCDIAFMVHATSASNADFLISGGGNGCMAKNIRFEGKASHAGGSPHNGINALYAANLGLNALNALRETFLDDEHVRVHPIMTDGGQTVNIIPGAAALSTFVRGKTIASIKNTNRKLNRAMAGAAVSMGAKVTIADRPGYSPLINDKTLVRLAQEVAQEHFGEDRVSNHGRWGGGSTDMGDLSCIMPAIHPYMAGCSGTSHGDDYRVSDPVKACLGAATVQVAMAERLLREDARLARQALADAELRYPGKDAFFADIDQMLRDQSLVDYAGDTVTVTL